ncbi:pentatricopeptide repeat-containing protein At1g59720, chloroplastic/mitochondrial [Mangifera indica]|uniref:pentatricopeptide repeat-containing protein At1g59720, chloroplastic/mitochondrial n=1 Tax=Mangifera indica TaxID=29780 RepID=UPI001CFB0A18|nr:pentatricopeptide repeat-containing protein At1g59720, chloroplastic/mitochondrial [Mangifera indica]
MALALSATPPSPPQSLSITNNSKNDNSINNYSLLLSSLSECKHMSQLKQIHAQILRTTLPHHHDTLFLYSRILNFASFADLDYAYRVFYQIDTPNSFMWNTLIRACAQNVGSKVHAISLYKEMLEEGNVMPDKHTFPFALKACAYLFALSEGKQAHAQILKYGCGSDVYINNSLIHFYASCGCLDLAEKLFENMVDRSIVSWNVMIDAFVQFGEFDSALKLFVQMQKLFEPDGFTLQSIISACAGLGALSIGMWAHAYILNKCEYGLVSDILINNSLVELYCKCGSLELAQQVFERMPKRDITSWNSIILGFAMYGQADVALEYFARLVKVESFWPNSITFVGVLSACNHRGMVNKGQELFDMMITGYNITPVLEHYGCLVDLLARAGHIDEALDIVSNMPMKPDAVIWRSLLDACSKKNASVELSEEVAKRILESEGGICSGVYVLLSRVYASASRWNDVGLVRKLMSDIGVTKEPGCSSIEINGVAHEFFAGDTSHPQTKQIYGVLDVIDERLKGIGYSPDYSQALMVDERSDGKQHSLRLHSERLAIALGLLSLKPGVPIRVFKNLRACNDCHQVTKLISKIFYAEIIVRDRARFHRFKDGSCSCMDYW